MGTGNKTGDSHIPEGEETETVHPEGRRALSHLQLAGGGGITWEGVLGTGRGAGTECYSTQTSPCTGGTLCRGRSLHAP